MKHAGRTWAALGAAGILATALVVVAVATRSGQAAGTAPEPGSEEDPVVTRSFVERYVASVLQGRPPAAGEPGAGAPGTGAAALQVVELAPGQRIVAEGGTEIVLRSGRARVVTGPQSQGGLSDLTAGRNVANGQEAAPDHLLLVPRSDGRGVVAVTRAWLVVRGAHTIE